MTKELTSGVAAAVAATVTEPGYLVRLELAAQTLRLSTRSDVTWNGELYIARGVRVTLDEDAETGEVNAEVVIADADKAYTAIVLSSGVADRPMSIWQFYGNATTLGRFDPVCRATGVGDEAEILVNEAAVRISMAATGGATMFSPRRYITKQEGFSILPPAGTVVVWAGEQYRLEGAQ